MAVASISLPQKLGVKLREKAEEAGYLPEEFGVELIRKSLDEELDRPRGPCGTLSSSEREIPCRGKRTAEEGGFGSGIGKVLGCCRFNG